MRNFACTATPRAYYWSGYPGYVETIARNEEGDRTADITFSNRSMMSYDALRAYLQHLRKIREAQDIRVDWSVVLPEQVKAINHDQLAGLQIADAVASGFYFAVNRNPYGDVEDRYMRLMMPTFYRHRGVLEGYGVKFWPDDLTSLSKSLPYLAIFQSLK